jgi:hypothetical protein
MESKWGWMLEYGAVSPCDSPSQPLQFGNIRAGYQWGPPALLHGFEDLQVSMVNVQSFSPWQPSNNDFVV